MHEAHDQSFVPLFAHRTFSVFYRPIIADEHNNPMFFSGVSNGILYAYRHKEELETNVILRVYFRIDLDYNLIMYLFFIFNRFFTINFEF